MGMNPETFLHSFVEGNLLDCQECPGDVRRAFNASVSASHLADHYFLYCKTHDAAAIASHTNLGAFVEHISAQTAGAFKDVRSISNAYKHLYTDLDPKYAVHSTVDSSGAIESIAAATGDEMFGSLAEEQYATSTSTQVVFTRKDGSKALFLPALTAVVEYWRTLLTDA